MDTNILLLTETPLSCQHWEKYWYIHGDIDMTIKVHTDFPCEYILNVLPASSTHIAMYSVIHVNTGQLPVQKSITLFVVFVLV